jgi:hypothetical protein
MNTGDNVNVALMHLIEELTKQVHEMREEFKKDRSDRDSERDALIARLLTEAFPEGDHEAHRKYHENLIKRDEARLKFWIDMRNELTKWGLFGFLGWCVFALWQAFLQGPTK